MPEPRDPGQPCKKMHSGALLIFRRLRPAPRRPAGPLSHLAQLPRDLDAARRRSAQAARVEEHFVLRGPDFGLDDLDGQILLVTAGEAGGAIRGDSWGGECMKSGVGSMCRR